MWHDEYEGEDVILPETNEEALEGFLETAIDSNLPDMVRGLLEQFNGGVALPNALLVSAARELIENGDSAKIPMVSALLTADIDEVDSLITLIIEVGSLALFKTTYKQFKDRLYNSDTSRKRLLLMALNAGNTEVADYLFTEGFSISKSHLPLDRLIYVFVSNYSLVNKLLERLSYTHDDFLHLPERIQEAYCQQLLENETLSKASVKILSELIGKTDSPTQSEIDVAIRSGNGAYLQRAIEQGVSIEDVNAELKDIRSFIDYPDVFKVLLASDVNLEFDLDKDVDNFKISSFMLHDMYDVGRNNNQKNKYQKADYYKSTLSAIIEADNEISLKHFIKELSLESEIESELDGKLAIKFANIYRTGLSHHHAEKTTVELTRLMDKCTSRSNAQYISVIALSGISRIKSKINTQLSDFLISKIETNTAIENILEALVSYYIERNTDSDSWQGVCYIVRSLREKYKGDLFTKIQGCSRYEGKSLKQLLATYRMAKERPSMHHYLYKLSLLLILADDEQRALAIDAIATKEELLSSYVFKDLLELWCMTISEAKLLDVKRKARQQLNDIQ